MEKVYADFVSFQQANFDAFVKSSTTFAKGFEQFSKHIVDLTTKSVEDNMELAKKFASYAPLALSTIIAAYLAP